MSMKLTVVKSSNPLKKYDAFFSAVRPEQEKDGKKKKTSFGAIREDGVPYTDYTLGADEDTKKRYLKRHSANEDWSDYTSAGALSRWILWGPYRSIRKNIQAFKTRYNLV